MKILVIHPLFPAQFKNWVIEATKQGHEVVALAAMPQVKDGWHGVRVLQYPVSQPPIEYVIHPWAADMEAKIRYGAAVFAAAMELKKQGYRPDCVIAYPPAGQALFIKDVWQDVPLGIHCEMFFRPTGQWIGFDQDFEQNLEIFGEFSAQIYLSNTASLMQLERADAGLSPTRFQANSYPVEFQPKISTIHEGVNSLVFVPKKEISATFFTVGADCPHIPGDRPLSEKDGAKQITFNKEQEIITYTCRSFEPHRGFHSFCRMLPELLAGRENAQVLIGGADTLRYSMPPGVGANWRLIFWSEIADKLTPEQVARVHFVGTLPLKQYIHFLQLSSVHIYLSYPLVVSSSLLEAMSCGCAIVAADIAPVRDMIENGENGVLVDFFDYQTLADRTAFILKSQSTREQLGLNARKYIRQNYDLHKCSLPKLIKWTEKLANGEMQ